ncbi:hypothetical protein CsatB_017590 [Cannabis sativa]|uniref:uncharacterized protein LOC133036203 n=1 Tax=Cannabis sativa TaxID=3483 RepID=UPI0029CA7827|nr:uncharacterized protein LOC133036203 [Cannabis sativa]
MPKSTLLPIVDLPSSIDSSIWLNYSDSPNGKLYLKTEGPSMATEFWFLVIVRNEGGEDGLWGWLYKELNIYKVISKVIANRLKLALPNAISTTQSAFLPGRLISDNIMVSFEIMHYLKRKRVGKKDCMALKLDMSKAYDRVGWSFLEAMLLRMGFCRKIVSLIMCCVSTVVYNVTYGGKVMGPILPRRGIRQGDPQLPYLFLVCAEGLSSLLQQYERNRWLTGCQVARGAPRVSHMLFADDSYVYCKANESEASRVLQLLQVYQRASGQQVNYAKSSIFFSNNTSGATRQRMSEMLGMVEALENSFYLGLPCIMGRNKNAILGFLKDKMQKKIFSWESRFLSKAGKEVLLKSVAQALPSYAMSVFLLTKEICSNLEGLMSKFWWKSQASSTSKGVSWMSWKRLCRHKYEGGIRFRDLRNYNLAFLGKQGWRLLNNENSLVSRIYKARYYPSGSYLTASLGPNPSFIWRSIYEAKDLVVSGVRKAIGDGTTVNITQDSWLPEANNPFVISDHPALEGQMVHCLFSVGQRSWDLDVIQELFGERDRQLILSIQLSDRVERDSWYWRLENSGLYTIKSAYTILQNSAAVDPIVQKGYKQLWKIDIPPKVQHFLWRATSGCLPTRVQLNTRHVNVDNMCPFCHQAPETICHVLLNCAFNRACWNVSSVDLGDVPVQDFGGWFFNLTSCNTTEVVREVAMVGWKIWAVRNDLVWNEKTCSAIEVVRSARVVLDQWKNAQSQKMGALLIDDINNVSERWRKPFLNMVKINVDSAIFQEENKFGFGLVARDHSCRLIEAVSGSRFGAVHPGVAEVIGVKEALSWIKRKQWSNVVVETNALVVVQAIKGSVNMPSQFGMLVRDCRDLMATLNNVSLCFVKQSANKAAHCVARGSQRALAEFGKEVNIGSRYHRSISLTEVQASNNHQDHISLFNIEDVSSGDLTYHSFDDDNVVHYVRGYGAIFRVNVLGDVDSKDDGDLTYQDKNVHNDFVFRGRASFMRYPFYGFFMFGELFRNFGEMGISLYDLKVIGGLPILGVPYEEFIPLNEKLVSCDPCYSTTAELLRIYAHICDYLKSKGVYSRSKGMDVSWNQWIEFFNRSLIVFEGVKMNPTAKTQKTLASRILMKVMICVLFP